MYTRQAFPFISIDSTLNEFLKVITIEYRVTAFIRKLACKIPFFFFWWIKLNLDWIESKSRPNRKETDWFFLFFIQEFYSEETVNNQGLECLRFLNEVIFDFDAVQFSSLTWLLDWFIFKQWLFQQLTNKINKITKN